MRIWEIKSMYKSKIKLLKLTTEFNSFFRLKLHCEWVVCLNTFAGLSWMVWLWIWHHSRGTEILIAVWRTWRTFCGPWVRNISPRGTLSLTPPDPTTPVRVQRSSLLPSDSSVWPLMKNLSFSGTFHAIQKSYEKSTDAVKRADAAKDTLKKSEGLRENALSDLRDVQPGNTKDLEKLKKDLATQPNLTPTANKVREIARDWLSRSVGFPADE